MRKKIFHPSEIPKFLSEEEFRDFWDTHEATEELLAYSKVIKVYQYEFDESKVTVEIINIPAINYWEGENLVSTEFEEHVKERLEYLHGYFLSLIAKNIELFPGDKKIRFDYLSEKFVK